jgi:hypothetical protein
MKVSKRAPKAPRKPVTSMIDPILHRGSFIRIDSETETPVRVCALDMKAPAITSSKDFVDELYRDLAKPEGKARLSVMCKMPSSGNPHLIMGEGNLHYWLQPVGDSPDSDQLMGPFCLRCMLNQAMLLEGPNGQTRPMIVYEISYSRALAVWLEKEGYYQDRDEALVDWGDGPLF